MFACKTCKYKTGRKSHLMRHMKRKYKCRIGEGYDSCEGDESCEGGESGDSSDESSDITYKTTLTQTDRTGNYNDENKKLRELLSIERFKLRLCSNIIERNLNIKIDDIFTDENALLTIKDIELTKEAKIIFQEHFKIPPKLSEENKLEDGLDSSESDEEKPKKKSHFMGIKQMDPAPEKSSEEIDAKILEIKEETKNENLNILENSEKHYLERISEEIEKLKTSRNYSKLLEEIKKLRLKLLGFQTLDIYIKYLNEQLPLLRKIFDERRMDKRKIDNVLYNLSVSPLECRLLNYHYDYDIPLVDMETDEISFLNQCLKITGNNSAEYIPFDLNQVITNLMNYSLCFFSLKDILSNILKNKYEFNSLIYLEHPKSKKNDPYTFYFLEKIQKEKRYWRMDCRLENLVSDLSENLVVFCIKCFRNFY